VGLLVPSSGFVRVGSTVFRKQQGEGFWWFGRSQFSSVPGAYKLKNARSTIRMRQHAEVVHAEVVQLASQ
jgi:hypothetical protein